MSQQVESITLTEWRHATPLVVQDGNDGPLDPQTDKYKLLNHIIRIAIKMYDSDTGQHALGWVAQSVVNKMRPDQHFPDYATGGSTPPEGNTRSPAERQMHAIGNLVPAFMEKIEKSFFAIHLTDDIPVLELVPLGHEASPRHGEAKAEPTFNGNLLSHYDAESAGTIKVGKTVSSPAIKPSYLTLLSGLTGGNSSFLRTYCWRTMPAWGDLSLPRCHSTCRN